MPNAATNEPAPESSDRREAMEAVAKRVGGKLVEGRMMGGYAVETEHGPWTLVLGLQIVRSGSVNLVHTRVVTHFTSRERFELLVRPRTFFDRVAMKVGIGTHRLGGRDFAERYVVRGRPMARLRSVFSGGLADIMREGPSATVRVGRAPRKRRSRTGPNARRLQVLSPGVDTDVDRSVALIDLARGAMDALERSGLAS